MTLEEAINKTIFWSNSLIKYIATHITFADEMQIKLGVAIISLILLYIIITFATLLKTPIKIGISGLIIWLIIGLFKT